MPIKKIISSLLLLVILWSPSAASASVVSSEQNRALLLSQIQNLLFEVQRLQAILTSRKDDNVSARSTSYTPYEATYYPLSFESIYFVDNNILFNTDSRKNGEIREVDKQMFDLFSGVIGARAVNKYVQEWRVFKNGSSDLGAFVELISGTDKWVVGVNRESYSDTDFQTKDSFANLFIHEYLHILVFEKVDFENSFKNYFWSTNDNNHSALVERATAGNRFSLLSNYFNSNQNRFVSDYSTISPAEDLAETFVEFVKQDRPLGNTIKEQKILAFYQDSDFVEVRLELRTNLRKLGFLK